ncbi:sugar phosphate isomerase/epimerase family protein [Bacillus sp. AK128]
MNKLGISTFAVYDIPLFEGIQKLVKAGFKLIEIMCEENGLECLTWSPEKLDELSRLMKREGVTLSIHAPFLLCNPASEQVEVRERSVQLFKDCLKLAEFLNAPYVLLHLGENEQVDQGLENSIRFIEEVQSFIPPSTRLVIENVPPKPNLVGTKTEELLKVCSYFGDGQVGIMYDVGHANLLGKNEVMRGLETIHAHLFGLHISDNYGTEDEHNRIGDGTVPLSSVLNHLLDKELTSIYKILEPLSIKDGIEAVLLLDNISV